MKSLDSCLDTVETPRPMSYRPPSRTPRGAWARHLHEQRRLRDLSQTQAFELVFERIGWSGKSRTAYVAIDMGERQPKPNEATVLIEEFGFPVEPIETDAPTDQAALIAALDRQSKALEALVALLVPVVQVQAQRLDEVEAVLDALVVPATRDGDERSASVGR